MPPRKSPKKSRKRKHAEIQNDSENDDSSLEPAQNPKRRRITKPKSKKKPSPPAKKPRKSPRKSPKKSKSSKEERDSDDSSSSSEYDQASLDLANQTPSQSQTQSHRNRNYRNKNHKPLQRKRISPKKRKRKRVSVSQSQTQSSQRHLRSHSQSQTQSQSQSQSIDAGAEEEEEEFQLVQHNDRVMEMYKWLTTSVSWMEIKRTLQAWVEDESDSQDTENYAELTLDIVNLMFYCGGVRVFKLEDIDDLDIDSLTGNEKDDLALKLQQALIVDHEDIEAIPEDMESENETQDHNEGDAHSEEEKAEEEGGGTKKKKRSTKKKQNAARTTAEKVLEFDVMLWRNGSAKQQNSFKSRYGQLMQRIGQIFEASIFDNDDYIITCILNWCEFFARCFGVTQFRKLGTWTVFSLCDPLIRCMAKNRKPMEKLKEQLEREKIAQRNRNNNKQRGSPRKHKKNKHKIVMTDKMRKWSENIEEYQSKIDNLATHVTFMFEKIAAYKAGDSNENIRCMVLEHIVKWINIDPSTDSFLTKKYYQYLLYGLQDKQSSKVRETALVQLMELFDYQHKFHGKRRAVRRSNKKKKKAATNIVGETESDKLDSNRKVILEPFWDRMRGCVDSLLKDKNENVVSRCIEFVNILLRGDMLGADDGDCILNYIFDESDEIRRVAAKFIFYDTFDEQAVLKSHVFDGEEDGGSDEEKKEDATEHRIRIKDQVKMKDDIIEIIQLMKDRVVDLNIKTRQLLDAQKQRNDNGNGMMKENTLYRNYVQVSDYIVQSMKNELNVLREWRILFSMLRDADSDKEINMRKEKEDKDRVEDMNIKHEIDEEGQTMLCYLILSCVKCVCNKLDTECRNVLVKRGRKSKENESELRLNAMNELKECVLPHLAVLLDIYQADVFKLYPLIQIIYLIPIDAFDGVRNKRYLDEILNSLKIIFMRHDTPFITTPQATAAVAGEDTPSSGEDANYEITEDMDEDQVREMEFKIRNKELKQLHQCIKTRIDSEMVFEIAKCFSFLCDKEYQFREHSGRFVFDIVTQLMDQFEDIMHSIESKLNAGDNLSTLDALLHEAEDASSLNVLQSLYSNLHKQYSLKCTMDVGPIQFTEAMHGLLTNIYDSLIFDGPSCEISNMLYHLLTTEISRCVHQLNFTSPDINKLHDLTQHKQELVQLFKYYVKQDYKCSLRVLDTIASMMETLCYFRCMKNQSQLLDHTLNDASFIEMEPVAMDIDAANNYNEISILKEDLLAVCRYVLDLALIEDPYDPSSHTTSENIQIRYLIGAARLCIMNPSYYKQFGANILSFYYKPTPSDLQAWDAEDESNKNKRNRNKKKSKSKKPKQKQIKSRRDEIIKTIAHKLMEQNANVFEEMLFESVKIIIHKSKKRKHSEKQIEKIAKSVSMMKGLGRNTQKRKSWSVFTKLMLDFICGDIENVPSHFIYLHCLTFFFRHFTNRDKLEIWAYFKSLSRKLPSSAAKGDDWKLYHQFKVKLKTEADKAQRNRNLALNDEDLENLDLDLNNNNNNNNEMQSGSIQVGRSDNEDINMGVEIAADEEEPPPQLEEERVAVAISKINIAFEPQHEETTRVSVAKSKSKQRRTSDSDSDEEQDAMDMDEIHENEDEDKEEKEASNEILSPPRRGGLGNKNKQKRNVSSPKQKRKSPAGKWLKRIKK